MSITKNTFCWMQLQSTNLKESEEFYSKLFQWSLGDDSQESGYTEFDAGEGPCGGMVELPEGVSGWLPFVQVADIDANTKKAVNLGATIIVKPSEISNGGVYSVLQDPTGAVIGLYQPPE